MKTVLITGFEPFGGSETNPALEAVKQLDGRQLKGGRIVACSVPVVRYRSAELVVSAIEKYRPDVVITVGQAAGRAAMTPERIAINIDDYRIADNEGNQVVDEPVIAEGPAAYFSTLPIKAITQALNNQGILAEVSNTAGTFVCNHLFYAIQHYLASTQVRHGFVHIPLLPEQVTDSTLPSMPLEEIVRGLMIAAQTCLDVILDIAQSAGVEC
ncbi:pyroglutamyl-peptidase I [Thaumasiovibrio subtropicus]|uniref:pyroglutamyl-peptidase I n=1 Tax=Thaumasiovibrio subtropicus TaxID=1891207 RepID=UPI000B34C0F9|nr:pyroglutamyl-peptidase I [Thaumasiovibrio subtropicus]